MSRFNSTDTLNDFITTLNQARKENALLSDPNDSDMRDQALYDEFNRHIDAYLETIETEITETRAPTWTGLYHKILGHEALKIRKKAAVEELKVFFSADGDINTTVRKHFSDLYYHRDLQNSGSLIFFLPPTLDGRTWKLFQAAEILRNADLERQQSQQLQPGIPLAEL